MEAFIQTCCIIGHLFLRYWHSVTATIMIIFSLYQWTPLLPEIVIFSIPLWIITKLSHLDGRGDLVEKWPERVLCQGCKGDTRFKGIFSLGNNGKNNLLVVVCPDCNRTFRFTGPGIGGVDSLPEGERYSCTFYTEDGSRILVS